MMDYSPRSLPHDDNLIRIPVFSFSLTTLQFCKGCSSFQGDHLSGNVGEFDSCQGNVRDFTKSQEVSGKTCLKLFIVSCIFESILDFAELVRFILLSDHALLHLYPPPLTITLVPS